MDLNTTQRVLARFYTDRVLQERFFLDPAAVSPAFGIAADEARQLADLSPAQVSGFSRSLERKRLYELQRALPVTCRALGPRLDELFGRHAAAYHPSGLHRHTADALAFAQFLSRSPGVISHEIADLARYEAHWLRFRRGRFWLLLAIFRSDPRDVSSAFKEGPLHRSLTIACWFRLAGAVRHFVIALPVSL